MLEINDKIPTKLKTILVEASGHLEGKKISFSSLYKEKPLVLFFYPKDMTPGCTTESQCFRDEFKNIVKENVNIVGCSRNSVKSHIKFIEKHSLNYPLLSDESGVITEAFGVYQLKKLYGREYMGIVRSSFFIEKGKIKMIWPKIKVKEHAQEVVNFLKSRN